MKLSDVTFLSMKDSDMTQIVGVPIGNYPAWREWMKKYRGMGISKKMFNRGSLIHADQSERFKKLFDKCTMISYGSYFSYGWFVDLGSAQVIVMSCKETGTNYEVVVERGGKKLEPDIKKVFDFMDMIGELLE